MTLLPNKKQGHTPGISWSLEDGICDEKNPKGFLSSDFRGNYFSLHHANGGLDERFGYIVGGFNPSEKYWSNCILSLNRDEEKNRNHHPVFFIITKNLMNTTKSFQAAGRGDFHRSPMEEICFNFLGSNPGLIQVDASEKNQLRPVARWAPSPSFTNGVMGPLSINGRK